MPFIPKGTTLPNTEVWLKFTGDRAVAMYARLSGYQDVCICELTKKGLWVPPIKEHFSNPIKEDSANSILLDDYQMLSPTKMARALDAMQIQRTNHPSGISTICTFTHNHHGVITPLVNLLLQDFFK